MFKVIDKNTMQEVAVYDVVDLIGIKFLVYEEEEEGHWRYVYADRFEPVE